MRNTPTKSNKPDFSTRPRQWLRLYSEIVDDDKLRLLAFEDRWHYVAILCCKAKGIIDAGDGLLTRRLAVRLGLSSRELEEVARRLEEVGLIDAKSFQPLAWDRRQFLSDTDPTNAARQKRHRDMTKERGALRNAKVTGAETETETETEVNLPYHDSDSVKYRGVHARGGESNFDTPFSGRGKP